MNKTELLDKLQNGYETFDKLIGGLSEAQLTTPGVNGAWSVKDNIAHLTAWHEVLLARLRAAGTGTKPQYEGLNLEGSEDEINERIFEARRALPLANVLADFRDTYQQVVEHVRSLDEAALFDEGHFPWMGDNALVDTIEGNTYGHYEEHTAIINAWLNR